MQEKIVDRAGKPLVAGQYYKDPSCGFIYLACKTGRNSEPNNITLFLAYPFYWRKRVTPRGHRFNMGRTDSIKTFYQVANLVPQV